MKSGFIGAPFTFIIFIITTICSLVSTFNPKGSLLFSIDNNLLHHPWCLFTAPFSHTTLQQTFFTLILLYHFRVLERRWSSVKFMTHFIFSFIITTLLSLFVVRFTETYNSLLSIHTIYLIHYYFEILPTNKIQILFFETSNNFFVYITYFFLLLVNNFKSNLLFALIGIIAAFILIIQPIPFKFPESIEKQLEKGFEYLSSIGFDIFFQNNQQHQQRVERDFLAAMEQANAILQQRQQMRNNHRQNQMNNNANGNNNNTNKNDMNTDDNTNSMSKQQQRMNRKQEYDQKVSTIVEMGFTREQAIYALNNTDDNLEHAISLLLDNTN